MKVSKEPVVMKRIEESLEKAKSLNELLEIIVKLVMNIIPKSNCSIYLLPEFVPSYTGNLIDRDDKTLAQHRIQDSFIVYAASSVETRRSYLGKHFYISGEGLTGWVFAQKKTLWLKNMYDPRCYPDVFPRPVWTDKYGYGHQVYSSALEEAPFLGIPLIRDANGLEGEAIGVLKVAWTEGDELSDEAIKNRVEELANNLAEVLVQRWQQDKRQQEEEILKAMEELKAADDFEEVLPRFIVQKALILGNGGGNCSLYLWDESRGTIVLRARYGIDEKSLPKEEYFPGEGLTGFVFQYNRPLRIPNIADKEKLTSIHPNLEWLDKYGEWRQSPDRPRQFLAVPLRSSSKPDRVIGVLRLPSHRYNRDFTRDDEKRLETFAGKVAPLVEHSVLQHRSTRAALLARLADAIGREGEQPDYRGIVDALSKASNGSHCVLYMRDQTPGNQRFVLAASTLKELKRDLNKEISLTSEMTYRGETAATGKATFLPNIESPMAWSDNVQEQLRRFSVVTYLTEALPDFEGKPLAVVEMWRTQDQELIPIVTWDTIRSALPALAVFLRGTTPPINLTELIGRFGQPTLYGEYNLTDQLTPLAEESSRILPATGCSIFVKNGWSNRFILQATTVPGLRNQLRKMAYEPGMGKTGEVIKTKKPLRLNRIPVDRRQSVYDICEAYPKPTEKWLAAPILTEGNQIRGVIRVARTERDFDFTSTDELMLCAIAAQVSRLLSLNDLIEAKDTAIRAAQLSGQILEHMSFAPKGLEPGKVYARAITLLTCKEGLQFNRAGIMEIINEGNEFLVGRRGIGSHDIVSAADAWRRASTMEVNQIIEEREKEQRAGLPPPYSWPPSADGPDSTDSDAYDPGLDFCRRIRAVRIPINDTERKRLPVKACFDTKSVTTVVQGEGIEINPDFACLVGTGTFSLAPVRSGEQTFLLLYVDNYFTRQAVDRDREQALATFALSLGNLIALHKAQAANIDLAQMATLGEFAAGLMHDMGQPATVLNAAAQYMEAEIEDGNIPERLRERVLAIKDAVTAITSATNWLHSFARGQQGEFSMVDLVKVVDEVLRFSLKQLQNHRIKVERDIPPNVPQVWGVAAILQSIILNLLDNARYAIDARGTLRKDGKITLRIRTEVDQVFLQVEDNGIGIRQEDHNKVFDPFFSTKRAPKGSLPLEGIGLGLTISRHNARNHDGDLQLEWSRPGEGTSFVLNLPCASTKK